MDRPSRSRETKTDVSMDPDFRKCLKSKGLRKKINSHKTFSINNSSTIVDGLLIQQHNISQNIDLTKTCELCNLSVILILSDPPQVHPYGHITRLEQK